MGSPHEWLGVCDLVRRRRFRFQRSFATHELRYRQSTTAGESLLQNVFSAQLVKPEEFHKFADEIIDRYSMTVQVAPVGCS